MLTKNLLKARIIDGVLKPTFITEKNKLGWQACGILCDAIKRLEGFTFNDLKQALAKIDFSLNPYSAPLMKVLNDAFISHEDIDFAEYRTKVFKISETERAAARTYEDFREQMEERLSQSFDGIQAKLYGDLGDESPMIIDSTLNHLNLVDAYNISLAKSFLVLTNEITIEVEAHSSTLRPLLSRIKFLGLMIEDLAMGEKNCRFKVSGPLALSSGAKAYGAKFVGVLKILTEYEKWSLQADLVHNNKNATLLYSHESDFLPQAQQNKQAKKSRDYVPDELLKVCEIFNNSGSEWIVSPCLEFINLGQQNYSFPDLKASSEGKDVHYIELFGRWAKTGLKNRLKHIATCRDHKLVLGIEKSLIKDQEIEKIVKNSQLIQDGSFTYRDIPGSKVLRKVLGSQV